MTNVSIEPGDAGSARRPHRRHRRRAVPRDATARGRSTTAACSSSSRTEVGARDPRRRARAAVPQPLLRRDHAAVLGLARRGLRPGGVAAWGLTNCGKGEPGQVMARLARRRAGALPRRPGRRRVTADAPLELAERALGARDGEAQATVDARALAAVALRPLAPDAGDRGRRHDASRSSCVRDGHTGSGRHEPTSTTTRCATSRARADAAARAAAARGGPRRLPRAARSRRRPRPATTAATPRPPRSIPARRRGALRAAFAARARARRSRRSGSGPRATSRRRSRRRAGVRARRRA